MRFFRSARKRTTPSIQRPLRPTMLRCLTATCYAPPPSSPTSAVLCSLSLLFLQRRPFKSNERGLFYQRRGRQIRERKALLLLLLLWDFWGLFLDLPCTLKRGASRENFSTKWMHSQKKTLLRNGRIKRIYFKIGASSSFLLHKLEKEFVLSICL